MKANIYIFLFIFPLLILYSCEHKPYPQLLYAVDSLTITHPDSTITLLENMQSTISNESEAVQTYYRLLCIKANDKAYILHTSDSLILSVLNYYIEKKDKQHLPEAYYYGGRVYRDLGDAPQALDYFKKALEVLPRDGGYELKSRIYSQMGTLFANQDLYDEALKMFHKGQQCDSILMDSIGMVFNFRDMAYIYRELGKHDNALTYFKKANLLSLQLQRTDLFNMIQSQLAALYTDLQEYDSAQEALDLALRNIEHPNKSSIYAIAARFYYVTNQMDSAIWYYNKLLGFGSVYAKRTAYRRLLEFAIMQNDTTKASDYLYGYLHSIDSIQKLTQTETINRMHSLYNYQLREKENMQLKTENRSKTIWIGMISSVLLFMIVFFIAYRQYNKRKKLELKQQLEKLQRIEKENQEKIELLERSKSQKEELEKVLANISISEDSVQKRQLGQKIELLNHILQHQKMEKEQEKEAQEYLFCSDLNKKLHERASSPRGEAYITPSEWDLLKEFMAPAYPTFFERLYSLLTPNENELHVCILLKLQFRPADIARLLQLKPESISSIQRRLYQKVTGSKGNPEMWNKIIYSL